MVEQKMVKKDEGRFARIVLLKAGPANIPEVRKTLRGLLPRLRKEKGIRRVYLLEAVDDQSQLFSLTFWDSQKDGENYEKSGRYKQNVDRVAPLLTEAAVVKSYDVLGHTVGSFRVPAKKKAKKAKKDRSIIDDSPS